MLGLEGCISGNLPENVKPPGGTNGPCAKLATSKPVRVVYGPGTFINEAVRQIQVQFTSRQQEKAAEGQQAAAAARKLAKARGYSPAQQRKAGQDAQKLVYAQFVRDSLQLALQYGIRSVPQINDPGFVSSLVFDPRHGVTTPKQRFAYLFPNKDSALIQVRLKPNLSDAQKRSAIAQVRKAVTMSEWKLKEGNYTVTGAPVVVADLATAFTHSIILLLIAALAGDGGDAPAGVPRAAAPAAVGRSRCWRRALTFGVLALVGASLTMASIARAAGADRSRGRLRDPAAVRGVREEEESPNGGVERRRARRDRGADDPHRRRGDRGRLPRAAPLAGADGARVRAAAGAGHRAGVRLRADRRHRHAGATPARARAGAARRAGASLATVAAAARGGRPAAANRAARRARAWRAGGPRGAGARGPPPAARAAGRRSRWPSSAGRSTRRPTSSPTSRSSCRRTSRRSRTCARCRSPPAWAARSTSRAASDLTDPKVVRVDVRLPAALLKRYGYSAKRGCGAATLCPAFSLTDLLRTQGKTPRRSRRGAARRRARLLLAGGDHPRPHDGDAGLRHPADAAGKQRTSSTRCAPSSHQPPGVERRARRAAGDRGRRQRQGRLLVAALRHAGRGPARRRARAAGRLPRPRAARSCRSCRSRWPPAGRRCCSSRSGSTLNPMSVTLGALVIAISTEFSVLLSERYRQERVAGHDAREALRRTYRSTGAAVLASGVTAIAGFAVLAVSDIRMLRDFGWVTVIDLTVSLLGVLVVLPAVLVAGRARRSRACLGGPARRPRLPRPRRRRERRAPRHRGRRGGHPLRPTRPRAAGSEPPRLVRRRCVLGWSSALVSSSSLHRLTTIAPRQRRPGWSAGKQCRPSRRRWRSRRSSATPTSPRGAGQGARARGRPARCAGPTPQRLPARGRARPGRARLLRHRAAASARTQLDRLQALRAPVPGVAWPPWRSRATATTCAPTSAVTAGASRSATTATGRVANLYGVAVCPRSRSPTAAGRRQDAHRPATAAERSARPGRARRGLARQPRLEAAGVSTEPLPAEGWVADEVAEEFPELRLLQLPSRRGRAARPPEIRDRLGSCPTASAAPRRSPCASSRSRRPTGSSSATSGSTPTRADADEAAALERLVRAASRSENLLDDALLVALIETGSRSGRSTPTAWRAAGHPAAPPDERLGRAEDAPPVPGGAARGGRRRGPAHGPVRRTGAGPGVTPRPRQCACSRSEEWTACPRSQRRGGPLAMRRHPQDALKPHGLTGRCSPLGGAC